MTPGDTDSTSLPRDAIEYSFENESDAPLDAVFSFHAVVRTLYIHPPVRGDFRAFLATAVGFGTAGVKGGRPFLDVRSGQITCERIDYQACP